MRAILTLIALLAVAAASCGDAASSADDGRLTVVASFYPIAEAARQVSGDDVEVVELTPAGVEPHDLELAPDDIEAIATADVVLYAGGGFQPAVEDALGEASGVAVDVTADLTSLPATEAGQDDEADHEDQADHEELGADPHVWLDPTRFAAIVRRVAQALGEADPGAGSLEREASYEAALKALDGAFRDGLNDCASRLLVVSHAAFGYLADAYDLHQEPISGVSPEAEPDPQRLAELRDVVTSEGVTTVFVESLVSPAVGETLAEEAGVTTAVLNPLEGLTPEQIDAGEDYLSVMRANLEALRDGLGCA
jgi:zinc transport system substrate-binding protein